MLKTRPVDAEVVKKRRWKPIKRATAGDTFANSHRTCAPGRRQNHETIERNPFRHLQIVRPKAQKRPGHEPLVSIGMLLADGNNPNSRQGHDTVAYRVQLSLAAENHLIL